MTTNLELVEWNVDEVHIIMEEFRVVVAGIYEGEQSKM